MLHTKLRGNRPTGSGVWRRVLKGFYHKEAWGPYWSCDPDVANKLSFPLPKEVPNKIRLSLVKRYAVWSGLFGPS